VRKETGLVLEQIQFIEDLCFHKLIQITDPAHHPNALTPRNLLLLCFKWLWRYPPYELLAYDFGVGERTVAHLIRNVLETVDESLGYLLQWKSLTRSRIKKGDFKDCIGAVDSFPVCIPQPTETEERKQFFLYKKGHKTRYAWKVQTFTDFRGRICSLSDAHPYGSIADVRLLRESKMNDYLGPSCRALHFPRTQADLEAKVENRYAAEPDADSDQKSGPSLVALGDKAYQGHPYVKVPHKEYKAKRMSPVKKNYNKRLSSTRVIVENVNKRLEDFKVLGTIYRGLRDSEFLSLIVRVVACLCNLKLEKAPMRRFPTHRR
jgi:hypothetical protein